MCTLQNIERIPDDLKVLYKTVWEIPQKVILEMAADRGAFIDQSQSLNVHIGDPTTEKLTSMHFFGWRSVSNVHHSIHFRIFLNLYYPSETIFLELNILSSYKIKNLIELYEPLFHKKYVVAYRA